MRFLFCLFFVFVLLQHSHLLQFGGEGNTAHNKGFVTFGVALFPDTGITLPGSFPFFIFKMLLFCMMCMQVYRNFS